MESPRPCDPPDISEVNLRILGGDPKAYFQNTLVHHAGGGMNGILSGDTSGLSINGGPKSPEEFQKEVPRDKKLPGEMIALFEDQNKNRVKANMSTGSLLTSRNVTNPTNSTSSMITMSSSSSPSSVATRSTVTTSSVAMNEGANGRRRSTDGKRGSVGSHVEINVDMTLAQSAAPDPLPGDPLVSCGGSNEITRNGQKTNNSNSSSVDIHLPDEHNEAHHHHKQQQQQQHQYYHQSQQLSPKLAPSCEKDLEVLKNVRKVYVQLADDNAPCSYKVSDESQECLFETVLGETNGSIWSRYFKQQQKVILVHDRNQRGVLKLEFGRSRTISCCQTLRFAAMTASFKLKPEEPLCIIFKDKECCVSCCCCPEATYETVPQLDSIHPFSVFTKGRWKNRAELMVKHSDGSILGFIDKEQNMYSLTMGENLKPAMKACLIGFLIAMDVMDRQDAGKLSCYLRPTTILLITLLLMLCITIGGYLLHHFSSMFLLKDDGVLCGTFDEAGSRRTAPVPHFNNDRTSDSTMIGSSSGEAGLSPAAATIFNASSSSSSSSSASSSAPSSSFTTSEFHFHSSSLTSSGGGLNGNNGSSTWPV